VDSRNFLHDNPLLSASDSEEDYSIFYAMGRGNYSEVLDLIDGRKGINAVDNVRSR